MKNFLLLILVIASTAVPQRRLRVKTIANITAESTTPATIPTTTTIINHTTDVLSNDGKTQKVEPSKAPLLLSTRRPPQKTVTKEVATEKGNIGVIKKLKNTSTNGVVVPKNTVISASSKFLVNSKDNFSGQPVDAKQKVTVKSKFHKKPPKIYAPLGNNHIHVESNYTVTSVPVALNGNDFGWKTSHIKGNVRRKNILTRTTDTQGDGSSPQVQIHKDVVKKTKSRTPGVIAKKEKSIAHTRPLVKPHNASALVYNFETGKVQRKKSKDQNPANSNEVPNEDRSPKTALPQKRFSSKYKKGKSGGQKQYSRGNHLDTTERLVETTTNHPTTIGELKSYKGYYTTEKEADEEAIDSAALHTANENLERPKSVPETSAPYYHEEDKPAEQAEASSEDKDDVKKKVTNENHSEGSGGEHHSDHHNKKVEKHEKGYKGGHHFDKGSKGHHDKEKHSGEYKDEKGNKKSHKEGGGHFEEGEHEQKGKKEAKHDEREEYKKGHSTRGGHVVHKLDEYEKKLEFYDESHDSGEGEKFGAHYESYGSKKGGHKKGGHKKSGSSGAHKGKKGKFAKGKHHHEDKGHQDKVGKESHYGHAEKYGKEGGHNNHHKYNFAASKGKGKGGGNGGHRGHLIEAGPEFKAKLSNDHGFSDRADHTALKVDEETNDDMGKHTANIEKEEEIEDEKEKEKEEEDELQAEELEDAAEEDEGSETKREENEKTSKGKKIHQTPKSAQFMNEDGPTSYFTQRTSKVNEDEIDEGHNHSSNNVHDESEPIQLDEEDEVDEIEEIEGGALTETSQITIADVPKGKGYFLTEEDAIKDRKDDNDLQVFNRVNSESGQRPERRYDEDEESEAAEEESQTITQTISFEESAPLVKIVSKAILPPL